MNIKKLDPTEHDDLWSCNEYLRFRPDSSAGPSSDIHGLSKWLPFPIQEYEGVKFYVIEDGIWQKLNIMCDGEGIFVDFYRLKK
jgi:hypothetical protein